MIQDIAQQDIGGPVDEGFDPDYLADPYYARIRRETPVFWLWAESTPAGATSGPAR